MRAFRAAFTGTFGVGCAVAVMALLVVVGCMILAVAVSGAA